MTTEYVPEHAEPTGEAPSYPLSARFKNYSKFLIALFGAICTAGLASFADSPTAVRWFGFVGGIVTALAVYFGPANRAPDEV